jgi:hypothetical protein
MSRREALAGLSLAACSFFPGISAAPEVSQPLRHEAINLNRFLPLVPKAFGELIASHIDKILEAGYGQFLNAKDFDHGHLVWKEGRRYEKAFQSGSLDAVGVVLYHTAESINRWSEKEKHLPHERRTPRSILGFVDGSIKPASEVVDVARLIKLRTYNERGTVFEHELPLQMKGLEKISWPADTEHSARSQFNFGLCENGRFETSAGKIEAQFSMQWP